MLQKIVKGRLGNQLFQYATIRTFQIKYFPKEKLNFDFRLVEKKGTKSNGFINSLDNFKLENNLYINKTRVTIIQTLKLSYLLIFLLFAKFTSKNTEQFNIRRKKIETKLQYTLNKSGIYWFTNGYYEFNFDLYKGKNRIFYGYFESLRYFDEIRDCLLKEFVPKHEEVEKNKKLYDIIKNSNSVCITIRRGDFISNPEYLKKHFICDEQYFYDAMKIMNKKIKNPQYIVFSDDVNWVKENMNFPNGTLYESGNDAVWEKLRLMYSCNHFIISNSTFSWWAQYLSNNKNKVVIAPKKWLNDDENPDFYDKNWILI